MRRLSAILAISVATHALALALASTWSPDRPPRDLPQTARIEIIDVQPPEPEPVDVTLLDPPAAAEPTEPADEPTDPTEPTATPEPTEPTAPPAASAPQVAMVDPRARTGTEPRASGTDTAGGTGTGSGTEPGTGSGGPSRNPYFDMRKGRPVRLTVGVPTGRWDGRDAPRETFGPDIDSGQLDPSGGGTHRSDQGPFTARVGADGSVTLKDKRNFSIRFAVPGKKAVGDAIASWYNDPNKPVGTLAPQNIERGPAVPSESATGEDTKPDHGKTVPLVSGGFDVTDALMRRHGQDPYAAKKLAFLDATRDQRVQIGQRYRQQQLEHATEIMQKNLERAWSVVEPAARRRALFELWDDCAETGGAELVSAGTAARTLVIGFIRSKLPAGSADAYTEVELVALNRSKQSKATFAPYQD